MEAILSKMTEKFLTIETLKALIINILERLGPLSISSFELGLFWIFKDYSRGF